MFKELLFTAALILSCTSCQAAEKVYVRHPEKIHQVDTTIVCKKSVQKENWFRLHQEDDFYIDVASIHGDDIGIYFYESDIMNIDPVRKFCVEYHILFRCDECKMLQEHLPPPCLNPCCPSRNYFLKETR